MKKSKKEEEILPSVTEPNKKEVVKTMPYNKIKKSE